MRKKIFTVLVAACSLMVVHADELTVSNSVGYAGLETTIGNAQSGDIVKVEVGLYQADQTQLYIPAGVTVIGGFKDGFTDAHRIYPGAATAPTAEFMTILDGNSLKNTTPGDKHRVVEVDGTLEGCLIRNGHSRGNGGGVLVNATGIVQNCIIKGNVAMTVPANDGLGGGAYLNGGKLISCVVAYNMANNGYGVAGNGEVINNTITANTYAPVAVEVQGGSYQHYKHWRNPNALPWDIFDSMTDLDPQMITLDHYNIAQTEVTTSQYAVFAAAMDLISNSQNVGFTDSNLLLSELTDPSRGVEVGEYMGFISNNLDVLFKESPSNSLGLQKVGNDFIYYSNKANEPMTYVSWNGSLAFSLWIGGSLPTEAQWEFAARNEGNGSVNNNMYAGSDNLNDVAWYTLNTNTRIQEVATKSPNSINIFDMSGNIWEWVADWINVTSQTGNYPDYVNGGLTSPYNTLDNPIWNIPGSGTARIHRGGSYQYDNGYLSIAYRASGTTNSFSTNIGFRPVLVP